MSAPGIIQLSDFVGQYHIARSTDSDTDLQSYIDSYEQDYLERLLGVSLAELFIADLSAGEPQTQIYIDIFEEFADDNDGYPMKSKGIKDILLRCVWFEYMRRHGIKNTTSGNVNSTMDLSEPAMGNRTHICRVYNDVEKSWVAIQWYILQHSTDYPDFYGQEFEGAF